MKAHGVSKVGRGWMVGALMVLLFPTVTLAWTHSGNATVEGKMGVGTESPARGFHLQGRDAIFQIDRDRDPAAFLLARTAEGNFNTIHKAYLFGVKGPGVNDGEFTIRDMGNAVSGTGGDKRLTIANDGQFAFGDLAEPLAGLHILNPVSGSILRLDGSNGSQVFTVQDDGDLYARGADIELRLSSTTTGGYDLERMSTLLANTVESHDEAFLALNGRTAIICSPGDYPEAILQIMDQNDHVVYYQMHDRRMRLGTSTDFDIEATAQHTGDDLTLSTTGDQMKFVTDSDNDTATPNCSFYWYDGGTASGNIRMGLTTVSGNLYTDGSMNENYAFDLAEAYWKSEDGIEAGDVVRIDPDQPNAVVLARAANDPAVVGVVSTDPGITMGGGAFSTERLEHLWGEDIGALFAKERVKIEKNLAETDDYIKERVAKSFKMKSALAKIGKKADVAQAKADIAQDEQELENALEVAAIQSFCEEHLAKVALAGRVPVKVDASYGAIQIGNFLVASATPGHAMRAGRPAPEGAVIGKALEAYASGQGTIMMMVLNR